MPFNSLGMTQNVLGFNKADNVLFIEFKPYTTVWNKEMH